MLLRYVLLFLLGALFFLPSFFYPYGVYITIVGEILTFWLLLNLTDIGHYEKPYVEDNNPTLFDSRAAAVYKLKQRNKAVLLIHGFSSNAYLYHKHIDAFENAGYDVIVPRLPGHGTCADEFVKTGFGDYYRCVKEHLIKYRPQYEHFHVVGISMGGLLTLNLAAHYSQGDLAPTSITTLAAPTRLKNPLLAIVRIASWFVPTLKGSWDPEQRESDGAEHWLGYHDLFLRQAYSLAMALPKVKSKLASITLPHFLVHARGDLDVPFDNVWEIARATNSVRQQVWVPDLSSYQHSHHSLLLYDALVQPLSKRMLSFMAEQERAD